MVVVETSHLQTGTHLIVIQTSCRGHTLGRQRLGSEDGRHAEAVIRSKLLVV